MITAFTPAVMQLNATLCLLRSFVLNFKFKMFASLTIKSFSLVILNHMYLLTVDSSCECELGRALLM